MKQYLVGVGAECQLRREIEIHSRLRHPHVIQFYTWFYDAVKHRIWLFLRNVGFHLFGFGICFERRCVFRIESATTLSSK